MKKRLILAFTAVVSAGSVTPVIAQDNLIYVAVEPCRVADTRISSEGVITANSVRNFDVAGTAEELGVQGGESDCLNPRPQVPVAAAVYVIAVATEDSGNGNLLAFPSDTQPGSGSSVNFRSGQNVGNTAIVSLCTSECPADGQQMGVRSNFSEQHVVIDVQGYFYPTEEPAYVWADDATAASYTPNLDYSSNPSGGAITITRTGTGAYTVVFAGYSAGVSGNVQVSRYGTGAGYCNPRRWDSVNGGADTEVLVECYDAGGAAVDARFTLLFTP